MADDALAEAKVRLRPELDRRATEQEVKQGVEGAAKAAASAIASLGLGKVIADSFNVGLAELKQQQDVAAQTEARLRATGGAANVSAEGVKSLAAELEALSGRDAEVIQSAENMLLTFKKVQNVGEDRIFDDATRSALDLSVAFGMDLQSATVMLGKALEDPQRGLTALRRVGVSYTAEQRDMIKALVESGNQLEAQKVILGELQTQVGGAARAYGETLAGRMERAKNAMDDAKASIVAGLAPALEDLSAFAVAASDVFQTLPQPVQTLTAAVVAGTVAFRVAQPAIDAVKGSMTNLGPAASSAASALGAAGIVVAGLATAYTLYQAAVDKAVNVTKGFVTEAEEGARGKSLDEIAGQIARIKTEADGLREDADNSKMPWDAEYRDALRRSAGELDGLANRLGRYRSAVSFLTSETGENETTVRAWVDAQIAAGKAVDGSQASLDRFNTARAQGQIEELTEEGENAEKALKGVLDAVDALFDAELGYRNAQDNSRDAQEKLNEAMAEGDPRKIAAATRELERAKVDEARAWQRYWEGVVLANGGQVDAAGSAEILRQKLIELQDTIGDPQARERMQDYIDRLSQIVFLDHVARNPQAETRTPAPPMLRADGWKGFPYANRGGGGGGVGPGAATPWMPGQIPGRAGGGSLTAGVPTLVGENGPEVVTAPGSGYDVLPGGAGLVMVNHFHEAEKPHEAAQAVAYSVGRLLTGRR